MVAHRAHTETQSFNQHLVLWFVCRYGSSWRRCLQRKSCTRHTQPKLNSRSNRELDQNSHMHSSTEQKAQRASRYFVHFVMYICNIAEKLQECTQNAALCTRYDWQVFSVAHLYTSVPAHNYSANSRVAMCRSGQHRVLLLICSSRKYTSITQSNKHHSRLTWKASKFCTIQTRTQHKRSKASY